MMTHRMSLLKNKYNFKRQATAQLEKLANLHKIYSLGCARARSIGRKLGLLISVKEESSVQINPKITVNSEGLSALLLVCWNQPSRHLLQLVTILVVHRVLDIYAMDGGQWNALGMACRHCQSTADLLSVVRQFLERGIQVDNANGDGNSALMALCANYG